jgi:hypothetical protein
MPIPRPHKNVTVVTVTPPGGSATTLRLKSGTVSVDCTAAIRRKASLELYGTAADFDIVTTPGAVFRITHGIRFGIPTDRELVAVFTGELIDGTQRLGDGSISIGLADHTQWLQRCRFLAPYVPPTTLTRAQTIQAIVAAAKPGTSVVNLSSDTGKVGNQLFPDMRTDAIRTLATDAALEAYFRADGVYIIRDRPTLTAAPVYTVKAGTAGTLVTASRRRPLDKLYNTWVVRPSAADGSQTWKQQSATITDTAHPRHSSKIGVVPYFWASPTIQTAANALAVAASMRDRALGTSETLTLTAIANPALDASDVVRYITPQINEQPALIFQHFIDQITLDLRTGAMSNQTRSQVDVNA